MKLKAITKKMQDYLSSWSDILVDEKAMLAFVEGSSKLTYAEKEMFKALWYRTAEDCELETEELPILNECVDCDYCDDCTDCECDEEE